MGYKRKAKSVRPKKGKGKRKPAKKYYVGGSQF